MVQTLLQVALGGAIGSMGRYLVNVGAMRLIGTGFPWGTLVVNIAGSFLMGALVVLFAHKDATRLAPFLMTGVLGGFTTFSAFSLDSWKLWTEGPPHVAGLYVLASVGMSFAALAAGLVVARLIWA
ncbi:MAG: fluoride efflux transporter CrcB [Pseudomonadota bacterium]|jgi:CrcB protein